MFIVFLLLVGIALLPLVVVLIAAGYTASVVWDAAS